MERMHINKSAMNRDMDWLRSHGCIMRKAGEIDGRVFHIITCGYSKRNLGLALDYFENTHKKLKDFLQDFIGMFQNRRPTLRDAKLLASMADLKIASRQELFARIYSGSLTTNTRALDTLLEDSLIRRTGTDG
jgi:hypothetical protein